METCKIIIQGGGEHARVVLDTLITCGYKVAGLFDPKYSGDLFGIPQLGSYDPNFEPEALAVVAIGDNRLRKEVVGKTKHRFTKIIHPSAIVSGFSKIGVGTTVLQGAIIQAQAELGEHVIVNTRASIDHDCRICDYVHIAPGAVLCGTVQVGEGALVGAGSVILPGIQIGAWAVVGAGAVVTRDVSAGSVVAGNPARLISR
ncbi:MAG: acetyltransferase [Chitinophagaceae bacterium]|nr:acetyltransferase [Chitinophagaceae bacterium]